MKKQFWWFVVAVAFFARTATASASSARQGFAHPELLVSADELEARLGANSSLVLHVALDRTEYEAGHVPGARFLDLSRLQEDRDGIPNQVVSVPVLERVLSETGIEMDRPVVLYDEKDGLLAARAFFVLEYVGHTRAALLDGGLAAWTAGGRARSVGEGRASRTQFVAAPREEKLVDADGVYARLGDPNIALIDARPAAQFRGDEAGEGVARPGHIPGATNLFWREAIAGGSAVPVLRPPAELRRLFERAGAAPGKTVVAYCRTGMQSAHTYFVARLLGYKARLYDGSFVEWSRRGLPVATGP